MKKKILLLFALIIACQHLDCQIITRSVLSGFGATQSNNSATLLSTFAQCPGCTTLEGQAAILTQGFQQPDDGCFFVAFDYEEESDQCGTSFSFFYTGNAILGDVNFEWDFGENAIPQFSNEANPLDVIYTSIGTKVVTLRIFDNDCDVAASSIVFSSEASFGANPNTTNASCKGAENGAIELEILNGLPPFSYQWSNGAATSVLFNLGAGDYAYTVTDGQGCKSINTVQLMEPLDSLSIQFDITGETCRGEGDGQIDAIPFGGTAPYNFIWSDSSTHTTLSDLNAGIYHLQVTDELGCQFSSSAIVGERCKPNIYNVISPNQDGINDFWKIEEIESFPDNEVHIYNRWGGIVFGVDGYLNNWNGVTSSGKTLPAGAYYYVIKLNNETNVILTGSVTIVR